MNVLSIGNSFSQDAHRWLYSLAKKNGVELKLANLFIGGCSLESHWVNAVHHNDYYELEWNGNPAERKISISEALQLEDWDVVTLQQVSHLSGLPETYEPYLSELACLVKKTLPEARLYFHQTWAYETDSNHGGFVHYQNDQRRMYDRVIHTTEQAAKSIDAALIPVGTVIQKIRENIPEFDYSKGGYSLCRDGFHLSYDYGRYTAAAVWLRALTGKNVAFTEFEDFDPALLEKILCVVNGI